MLQLITPPLNQPLTYSRHVMVWIKSGNGLIEVDFQTFSDFEDRVIFLSPGQRIKFVFGTFEVALLEFPDGFVKQSKDYRVLFKHLISLGYIEFTEAQQQTFKTLLSDSPSKVLDISTHQWFWQNPFKAEKEEYTIIFDLKEVIDTHFKENWSVEQFVTNIDQEYFELHRLVKNRLGLTIKHLAQRKLLVESQRDIAFTDKPIQEVAYDMGFRDPAYFHRFFKAWTHLTPKGFREQFGSHPSDTFIQDLLLLIQQHHPTQRATSFYADKLFMSIKTLSRKVKDKLNMTVGDLIRVEVIQSAKRHLQNMTVKETAFLLGFEEANHFSAFFKKYTGITPSQYQSKKYNS